MDLRQLVAALVAATISASAFAIEFTSPLLAPVSGELFTPGLPASPDQSLCCRIVNVTFISQVVSSQALDSKGQVVAGMLEQTLAPGESGGFSVSGRGGAMYCRFRVNAPSIGFRTSIEVFETIDNENFRIVAALPGF